MRLLQWFNNQRKPQKNNTSDRVVPVKPYAPEDLLKFETRRSEIQYSTEPVVGIFYIMNDEIIPDYSSEAIITQDMPELRKQRYHYSFYRDYMIKKYSGLPNFLYAENIIPRGRIEVCESDTAILIDACYKDNENIITMLKNVYRLPASTPIKTNPNYCCPKCQNQYK